MAQKLRFEGLTLAVENVATSVEFYGGLLGLTVAYRSEPAFALIKVDGGGSIGLLSVEEARKEGVEDMTPTQRRAIHVELSVDDLDSAYQELLDRGMRRVRHASDDSLLEWGGPTEEHFAFVSEVPKEGAFGQPGSVSDLSSRRLVEPTLRIQGEGCFLEPSATVRLPSTH